MLAGWMDFNGINDDNVVKFIWSSINFYCVENTVKPQPTNF